MNPKAIEAMKELGYDLTTHTSKGLDAFNGKEVEVAVTMGCGDECPLILAKRGNPTATANLRPSEVVVDLGCACSTC